MCARAESGIGRHLHVQGLSCRCGGGKLRDGPGSHDPAAQPLKRWNVEKLGVEIRQVLLRVDLDQFDDRLVSESADPFLTCVDVTQSHQTHPTDRIYDLSIFKMRRFARLALRIGVTV